MSTFVLGAMIFALAAGTSSLDKNQAADASQRGSNGAAPSSHDRTGPPAPGIETGKGNGLAGGRNDMGPRGGTGIRGEKGARHVHRRARANSQARARNPKGSLSRPADTPPRINRNPKAIGSGAPTTPVAREPQPQGRNLYAGPQQGAAGGTASDTGPSSPGAAATTGTAGKAAEPNPN